MGTNPFTQAVKASLYLPRYAAQARELMRTYCGELKYDYSQGKELGIQELAEYLCDDVLDLLDRDFNALNTKLGGRLLELAWQEVDYVAIAEEIFAEQ